MSRQALCTFLLFYILCIVNSIDAKDSHWARELDRLDKRLEKAFSKKYRLNLKGVGGGGVQGFHRYSPQFQRLSPTTKEEARELIFALSEEILEQVNSNETLKNGMVSYPFTHANLGVAIFYNMPNGDSVKEGEICIVSIYKDEISYALEKNDDSLFTRVYEPIREALEKIEGSRQKFPFIWECVEKQEAK